MSGEPEELKAAAVVRSRLDGRQPSVAVVLGSGLGSLAERITDAARIHYSTIPGFPPPGVAGHKGELVCGGLAGKMVIAQSGRFHLYEGHGAESAALPIRVFAELGVERVILTNAAGGIRRTFSKGALMLIADQINLSFRNPVWGPVRQGEERFPDMSDPFDYGLRAVARQVARGRGIPLEEGVYAGVLGPSYETPAEIRMLHALGADAVGMSTVSEAIAARAAGLRCLGISTITNMAAGLSGERLTHDEVIATAERVRLALAGLIEGIVGAGLERSG